MADDTRRRLEQLESRLALPPHEQARVEGAPFPNDPTHWMWFAAAVRPVLLDSYRDGHMTLEQLLRTMRNCALGCDASTRVTLLGMLVEEALRAQPAPSRKRPFPVALQKLAAALVEFLRQERPGEKLQTLLDEAVSWLTAVGICDTDSPISSGTLRNWYNEQKRQAGDEVRRGRPPNRR